MAPASHRFPISLPFLACLMALFIASCAVNAAQPTPASPTAEAVTASPTATPIPPTETPAPAPTDSITPTASPSPAPTDPPYPTENYITNISGHKQYFSLGCEASVAKDWAAYFGVQINEFNFQYELPLSDNPDKGFVGDVNGPWGQVPPYAYGVHAAPVAELLRQYGLPAQGYKQMTIEQIKAELGADRPVIAWVVGNMEGGVPAEYTDKEGDTTLVAAYEHVVLVTGYNEKSLRYNSNGKFYDAPTAVFENSWGVLDNMAIIYEVEDASK